MVDFDCFELLSTYVEDNGTAQPAYRLCEKREVGTQTEPLKKKKHRGNSHPGVCQKTEEKDKFWLRAFRSYMISNKGPLKTISPASDRSFWREYLSSEGRPEHSTRFRSYNQQYKNYLFSHPTFLLHFRQWFSHHGESELSRKSTKERNSEATRCLLEYGLESLFNYTHKD